MSKWNHVRDTAESAAALAGNYFLPGSELLTAHLVSRGSQRQLGSTVGQVAGLATGLAGAGVGSNYTGIPASSGWSSLIGGGTQASAAGGAGATGAGVGTAGNDINGLNVNSNLNMGVGLGAPAASTATAAAPQTLLQKLAAGVSHLGTPTQVGAGLYGLYKSNQLNKMAQQLAQEQQPFDPYRAQYAQQLNELMANPSQVTRTPGYQAGLEAIERSMAAGGYLGSGNMMAAMMQYGGNAYQQALQNLAGLAGANVAPGAGAGLALEGGVGSTQGVMSSLGLLSMNPNQLAINL